MVVNHGLLSPPRQARVEFMLNANIAPRLMTLDEFLPLVGQVLLADCNPKPAELKLVQARPLTNHGLAPRPPFILILRSTPEILLVAGTYAMRCGEWGPDLIYIEQIASLGFTEPGHFYQAIFN
jgi:hypothetical protein